MRSRAGHPMAPRPSPAVMASGCRVPMNCRARAIRVARSQKSQKRLTVEVCMSTHPTSGEWIVTHPLDPEDAPVVEVMRGAVRAGKGVPLGVEARGRYDALIGSIPAHDDVM